jgi:hypothetical protein
VELKVLLHPNGRKKPLCKESASETIKEYDEFLSTHAMEGPILLRGFLVHKHFKNASKLSCHGHSKGYWRFDGSHDSRGEFVPECMLTNKSETKVCVGKRKRKQYQTNTCESTHLKRSSKSDIDINRHHMNYKIEGAEEETSNTNKNDGLDSNNNNNGADALHTMLIIGGRRDENGKLWLLVQNWWFGMPLVEISVEYLVSTSGSCFFVPNLESKQLRSIVPHHIQSNSFDVTECQSLGQTGDIEACMFCLDNLREGTLLE